jgi:hypothetical protein
MSATVDAMPQSTKMTATEQVHHQLDMAPTTNDQWRRKIASWSPEERAEKEKKFLRKIDLRLLPILVSVSQTTVEQIPGTMVTRKGFILLCSFVDPASFRKAV